MEEAILTKTQMETLHKATKQESEFILQYRGQLRRLDPQFRAYVDELIFVRGEELDEQKCTLVEAMENGPEEQYVDIMEWQQCRMCTVFTRDLGKNGTGLCWICAKKNREAKAVIEEIEMVPCCGCGSPTHLSCQSCNAGLCIDCDVSGDLPDGVFLEDGEEFDIVFLCPKCLQKQTGKVAYCIDCAEETKQTCKNCGQPWCDDCEENANNDRGSEHSREKYEELCLTCRMKMCGCWEGDAQ